MKRILATMAACACCLTIMVGCESDQSTEEMATVSMGVINDTCPVMEGGKVPKNPETATHNGYTVGFCCAGCSGKWEEMSNADKNAFIAKYTK